MKKILFLLSVTVCLISYSRVDAQKVNGQTFSFPNGKTEWSDTVYKKVLTKEMAKEGLKAVPIGIRYKFVKSVDEGNWYAIEISNISADSKVKFRVVEKNNQEAYTVSLEPKQTKVIQKLYLRTSTMDAQNQDNTNSGYLNQLLDEMDETRY
ncbi:MAG: hypothetical protein NTW10_05505 [Bacteroidetes bacterium]|nr:hypothetical protein [Bacteroidota bacterium]